MAEGLSGKQVSLLRRLGAKRKLLARAQKMHQRFPGNVIWQLTIDDLALQVAVLTEKLCLCPKWTHPDDYDGWEDFELACILSDCPLHSGRVDIGASSR